jgi:hypothetical protein
MDFKIVYQVLCPRRNVQTQDRSRISFRMVATSTRRNGEGWRSQRYVCTCINRMIAQCLSKDPQPYIAFHVIVFRNAMLADGYC